MNKVLRKIFKKDTHIIIGVIHFPPLLGFSDFPGYKETLKNALADLRVLEEGGVDGIFLENNYGLSKERIDVPAAISMGYLCGEIRKHTKLPLGASVLWNDYEASFALAKTYNLQFIRVPVFVDTVKPYCGVIKGESKKVMKVRKCFGADDVAVFADIHVKHAELISKMSITASAKKAMKDGADGIIMTGGWTGVQPDMSEIQKVRNVIGDFPILVGSGADKHNVEELLSRATGIIVSTSLKKGGMKKKERNVKGYEQRIDRKKVAEFMGIVSCVNKK